MKKIINFIIFSIFGIVIIFNIISIVTIKVLKKDYINIFGYTYFEVQTGSMMPDISIGDTIIVKLDDKYEVGDIITYKNNGDFITHRIVSIDENVYITKGDSNNTVDKSISKDQVIGKVVKKIDNLGNITKVLKKPLTLIIIFMVGTLIILFTSLVERKIEE